MESVASNQASKYDTQERMHRKTAESSYELYQRSKADNKIPLMGLAFRSLE